MTLTELKAIKALTDLAGESAELQSLWCDYIGNWDEAHGLVDGKPGLESAWVHAYLHRKEGDLWNADYWYRRADRERPEMSLEQEWEQLTQYFLIQTK